MTILRCGISMSAVRTFRESHGMEGGATGPDDDIARELLENIGATIMGRHMFGGGEGHTPVFVLTHHPRKPLEMQGGTTFHFVTGGIHAALEQAREAARGKDVSLGGGARLFENTDGRQTVYECVRVVSSPSVGHFKYRLKR